MRRNVIPEWILARFTKKESAAAILGDLQEFIPERGEAWFWRSFCTVLASVAQKSIAGYLFAMFGAGFLLYSLPTAFSASTQFHSPGMLDRIWASSLAVLVGLMAVVAVFAMIRFGVKDILGNLAAAYSALGTVAVTVWWRKDVVLLMAVAAVILLMIALFFQAGRRGIVALASIIGLQCLLWLSGFTALGTLIKHFRFSLPVVEVLFLAQYLVLTAFVCGVCAWLHAALLDKRQDPKELATSP